MNEEEYKKYIRELKYKIDEQQNTIRELNIKLKKEQDTRQHCEFLIETELEPRIKQEKVAYDAWVTTDKRAEAADCFEDKINELIEMVKENPAYFEWDSCEGDIYQMILYLIRFHILPAEKIKFSSFEIKKECEENGI